MGRMTSHILWKNKKMFQTANQLLVLLLLSLSFLSLSFSRIALFNVGTIDWEGITPKGKGKPPTNNVNPGLINPVYACFIGRVP